MSNSKPVSEGTVIMADSQFAGRGQQQNRWHSQPGKNLTFSLLLRPTFLPLAQQYELNRAVSWGVAAAIEQCTAEAIKIKWPNDIYWGDKKLGGILIENVIQGSQIKHAIIGIGINVNQVVFDPIVPNPVSISQMLHRDYDLLALLSEICKYIEVAYLQLKAGRFTELRQQYMDKLYWLNEVKQFKAAGAVFTAKIIDVRNSGLLLLSTENGEAEYDLKQIEFLNK